MKLKSASETANEIADDAAYKAIEYKNVEIKGPALIVIPGSIKSSNATFTEKVGINNIADYAEIELQKANFRVLERANLGPLLEEIRLAANLGDRHALRKLKRGKLKTTKWFVRFDILKAEPVAEATVKFDGAALSRILGAATENKALEASVASVKKTEAAGVWLVGLRYTVINANTTEQVSSNYFEEKMQLTAGSQAILGFEVSKKARVTLDTMAQRLVQRAVAELDTQKGPGRTKRTKNAGRAKIRNLQKLLMKHGFNPGIADGIMGPNTRSAIMQFQDQKKLESSGKFDGPTIKALRTTPIQNKETPDS